MVAMLVGFSYKNSCHVRMCIATYYTESLPVKHNVTCGPDNSQYRLEVCLNFREHIILQISECL